MFLVLIFARGCVDLRAMERSEGDMSLKNSVTPPGIDPGRKNISTIYIYITRLASKEIFSPLNKIHREVGRAKDLSAHR
jgi:hypothetical protein